MISNHAAFTKLFVGIQIEGELEYALQSADPSLLNLFICNDNQDYLQKVFFKNQLYLGKFADEITNSKKLGLLEANIKSLLQKAAPGFPWKEGQTIFFSTSQIEQTTSELTDERR